MKRNRGTIAQNYLILLVLVFLSSCSSKYNVEIRYYPRGTTSPVPISCEMLLDQSDRLIRDTIITDKAFYKVFLNEVNKLETGNPKPYDHDVRIRIQFYDKAHGMRILCCGEYFDIVLDGDQMSENNSFYKLVSETIFRE